MRKPSVLTIVMLAATVLMLVGHAGTPTWYWAVLPAFSLCVSVYVDQAKESSNPRETDG